MAQGRTIPIRGSDSPQGQRVVVGIFFTRYPQPKITPIATAADNSILAEAVPIKTENGFPGWIVRLRAQGSALPRFKDSENVYPSLTAAEDAYWRQCEAERFREDDVIEWGHWQEAVAIAAE
jgi:hypothetical protein